MEDKIIPTVTMSLFEYQNWEIHNKFNLEEIKELKEQVEKLQSAKAVIIHRTVTFHRNGTSRTDELRPRIYGKGVELNKAIQELRDEVDTVHIGYIERESKMRADMEDLTNKRKEYTLELLEELDTIKSKWWYKLLCKHKK